MRWVPQILFIRFILSASLPAFPFHELICARSNASRNIRLGFGARFWLHQGTP
jgi:hypothetical protein